MSAGNSLVAPGNRRESAPLLMRQSKIGPTKMDNASTDDGLLFDIPESLSPRLQWMRDNGITTEHEGDKWIAKTADCEALAETEETALWLLAKTKRIKTWNQK